MSTGTAYGKIFCPVHERYTEDNETGNSSTMTLFDEWNSGVERSAKNTSDKEERKKTWGKKLAIGNVALDNICHKLLVLGLMGVFAPKLQKSDLALLRHRPRAVLGAARDGGALYMLSLDIKV